ncbi:hypothetical protein JOC85_001121 [Bacillus mesophilus]|uniref:Uncharacterized protein n=1 Tax=Bacillus mesophilus TaxID=1808955 RepID=A0A6M0Q4C3_9BACI|nr:hypothetical protein [Bacillus mesophilus]MBM7660354.1 hypothetical protein [Bacillus mesophilus]NEY71063.1 hypothetical protein [Bacillus mesophilus]
MKKNQNRYYYMGLVFIHSILLFFTFYRKSNKKTIFFTFLSIIGLAFHFEYPLYISKAYKYRTKMLREKEQDNSLGSILSQGLFVPSAGIFISVFQLGWKIKLLFTLYFVLIERFFVKVKVYRNKWWKTSYTGIFIFLYFFISDAWYKGLKKENKNLLNLTVYHSSHVIYMCLLFLLSLSKKFRYQPKLVTFNPWYHHYSFVKVYLVVKTAFTTLCVTQRNNWIKLLPFGMTVISDFILIKYKILRVKGSYGTIVFPIRITAHVLTYVINKLVKRRLTEG